MIFGNAKDYEEGAADAVLEIREDIGNNETVVFGEPEKESVIA